MQQSQMDEHVATDRAVEIMRVSALAFDNWQSQFLHVWTNNTYLRPVGPWAVQWNHTDGVGLWESVHVKQVVARDAQRHLGHTVCGLSAWVSYGGHGSLGNTHQPTSWEKYIIRFSANTLHH